MQRLFLLKNWDSGWVQKVEIGQRTMMVPRGWDGQPADGGFLQKAIDKGLMVWTREMLEPTISAFKSQERL